VYLGFGVVQSTEWLLDEWLGFNVVLMETFFLG
jgi:hypothetical protein